LVFLPGELNGKASINVVRHAAQDVYNPTDPFFGNTNLATKYSTSCPKMGNSDYVLLDWVYTQDAFQDLRMTALNCA